MILTDFLPQFYQGRVCKYASGALNDCRCNSSSTKAGVLIAHHQATARPLPKELRTITGGGSQSPSIIVPSGWRESAYLYDSLSSVNSRCPPHGGVTLLNTTMCYAT
ncbi:hypothetical protein AVEN_74686-1 [Araneus ventricosus]|uniref:Uncharacterized protein n=1 Tax=Araneus ventricosus TaxID=182803 RepID=A0A4Y2S438_ARAVE|nr:hypothetical protein AVEN_74686-1 [Araneus ventricosus]